MSVLRKLSVIYMLGACALSVLFALDRNPAWKQERRTAVAATLDTIRDRLTFPTFGVVKDDLPDSSPLAVIIPVTIPPALTASPVIALIPRQLAAPVPVAIDPPAVSIPSLEVANNDVPIPEPVNIAPPHLPPRLAHAPLHASATPTPPAVTPAAVAPSPATPAIVSPSSVRPVLSIGEIVRVTLHLKQNLTREMQDNFGLFLYVSKAETGPLAQRLYVFHKDAGGNLAMLYNWPASTGREKDEIAPNGTHQPSFTPQGYYQFDPRRMYRNHVSGQWHEPMPYAMFFNWQNKGLATGLAIHGATALELAQLGTRASAGCIRLAPENAALLFKVIREQYKGLAPRFAYDRRTATMSNQGVMMHDAAGSLTMANGYKVLVFVENYGGENVVAALF